MDSAARRSLPLLGAKTRLPLAPPGFVSRQRLLLELSRGLEKQLTMVAAPAGYGKTALLGELARGHEPNSVWLSLERGDADLAVFVRYLVAAVARIHPHFGESTLAWLDQVPNPAASLDDLATTFVADLDALEAELLVIILDDFHLVARSESILRFLDFVLRYLPPAVRIVLGSRTPVGLLVTRLVVQQQVSGLGAAELAFTLEETEGWLLSRDGRQQPEEALRLCGVTEGWIAGMILYAAADASPMDAGLSARQAHAYLSAEVLEQQSPEVRRFLLYASVLDHLTPSSCQEILGFENAVELLHTIYERQLFLSAAGSGRSAHYRLHQLFRDFLSARLRAADPEAFVSLHRRAAAFFEAQGDPEQAMQHLLAIADWEPAARLAIRAGPGEIQAGHFERVRGWLQSVPSAAKEAQPGLLLIESQLLAAQSEIPRAAEVLAVAERLLFEAGDRRGYAAALALGARIAVASGEGRRVVELAYQALQVEEADALTHAHAAHNGSIGYAMLGETALADKSFGDALAGFRRLGDSQNALYVAADWGTALLFRGDHVRAVDQLAQALTYARQVNHLRQQTIILTNLAVAHQELGDLDTAEKHLATALELARQARWRRVEASVLISLADNAVEREKLHDALSLYRQAAEVAQSIVPALQAMALAGQARCLRRAGRYGEAERLARRGLDTLPEGAATLEAALCRLETGALQLVHSPALAESSLRAAEGQLRAVGRKREAARAGVLLATALFASLRVAEAEAALAAAYSAAVESGSESQLVSELVSVHSLALLRRAGKADARFAALLARVVETLEHEKPGPPRGADAAHGIVRWRPYLLEAYSLGPAIVYRDGVPVSRSDWQSTSAKELFFFLLEHPAGERKEVIQATLWPEHSPLRARNNLNVSLLRLRGALGADVVVVEDPVFRLNPQLALWHDGSFAFSLLQEAGAAGDTERARAYWAAAAELLTYPFAEEFTRDWAGVRRHFWHSQASQCLSWLALEALEAGRYREAVAWAQKLVGLDPLEEAGHLLLMRAFAVLRSPDMVTRQYNELARLLQYELDAAPSGVAQALYRQLLREVAGG